MICPHCHKRISDSLIAQHLAAKGGRSTSEAKAAASRENGKRGGRPRKEPIMPGITNPTTCKDRRTGAYYAQHEPITRQRIVRGTPKVFTRMVCERCGQRIPKEKA